MLKRKEAPNEAAAVPVRLLACDVLGLVKGTLVKRRLLADVARCEDTNSFLMYFYYYAGIEAPHIGRLGEAKVVSTW